MENNNVEYYWYCKECRSESDANYEECCIHCGEELEIRNTNEEYEDEY